MPPSVEEINSFEKDRSPGAYEKVVDRLLASPAYGERWGRHWLDLMRYAETSGHEFDYEIPHAYRFRDYIIRAFNADVPYDQLVREHIAGDLMTSPRRRPLERTNESILGTGLWFLGESKHSPVDLRVDGATARAAARPSCSTADGDQTIGGLKGCAVAARMKDATRAPLSDKLNPRSCGRWGYGC